jgi:hypothetical protein
MDPSTGEIWNPPQTHIVSYIQTRKSVGENIGQKLQLANSTSADIRSKTDPLPSLCEFMEQTPRRNRKCPMTSRLILLILPVDHGELAT